MIQRRRPVPFELGPVHFIGIGGIGMDDTLNKVRPDELAQNVAAWASFLYLVADSDIDFRALSAAAPAAASGH